MTHSPEHSQTVSHRPSLVRVGGAMGIAACAIGLLVFLASCAGFNAAMVMSIIPLALSAGGLTLSIIGGVTQSNRADAQGPHVVAALFVNLAGLIGAVLLLAVWQRWPVLAGQGV